MLLFRKHLISGQSLLLRYEEGAILIDVIDLVEFLKLSQHAINPLFTRLRFKIPLNDFPFNGKLFLPYD